MKITNILIQDGIYHGDMLEEEEIDTKTIGFIIEKDINGFACEENIFEITFNTDRPNLTCIIN